jgi:tRNA(fMet)-specific endonuclease VapC
LFTGVKLKESVKLKKAVEDLIERLEILPFTEYASFKYADIRSSLQKKGQIIEDMDMLIAACVIAEGAVLITNNEKHFSNIDGLKIENWTL